MNQRRRNVCHALSRTGLLSISRASLEWEQGRCLLCPASLDFPMPFVSSGLNCWVVGSAQQNHDSVKRGGF